MRARQAAAGAVGEEGAEEATPIAQLAALTVEDRVETRRRPRKRGGQRTRGERREREPDDSSEVTRVVTEQTVAVSSSQLPELIGKDDAIVRKLEAEFGVEVKLPQAEAKRARKGKKAKLLKVTIAGPTEKVEGAKRVVQEILLHHHSELTHPGDTHIAVPVDPRHCSLIFGTGGSEIRHIQSRFKVSVFRDVDEILDLVWVRLVGPEAGVERAAEHIAALLSTACLPSGDEEDASSEEDWFEDYEWLSLGQT